MHVRTYTRHAQTKQESLFHVANMRQCCSYRVSKWRNYEIGYKSSRRSFCPLGLGEQEFISTIIDVCVCVRVCFQ